MKVSEKILVEEFVIHNFNIKDTARLLKISTAEAYGVLRKEESLLYIIKQYDFIRKIEEELQEAR